MTASKIERPQKVTDVSVPQPPVGAVRKSGEMTDDLKTLYAEIASQQELQMVNYKRHLEKLGEDGQKKLLNVATTWELDLNLSTGKIRYLPSFKPINLSYDACYIRHGKTEGNTEPRIYQGYVDYWENQLTSVGEEQAILAAERMQQMMERDGWIPDLIVCSPLLRARRTAAPFANKNPDIPTVVVPETGEMRFGDWDNRRVIDVPGDSIAHLFYLQQNTCVSADKPHVVQSGFAGEMPGTEVSGECFIDVIARMAKALKDIETLLPEVKGRRPRVLFYGHSMAGAAVSILLGHGKRIPNDPNGSLGFDGSLIMANATPALLLPQS